MADWHDRPPTRRAPWCCDAGVGASRSATDRATIASLAGRCVPALHPPDAGQVPQAHRQPAIRDGVRTRLSRRSRSLPPHHRLPAATAASQCSPLATVHSAAVFPYQANEVATSRTEVGHLGVDVSLVPPAGICQYLIIWDFGV